MPAQNHALHEIYRNGRQTPYMTLAKSLACPYLLILRLVDAGLTFSNLLDIVRNLPYRAMVRMDNGQRVSAMVTPLRVTER